MATQPISAITITRAAGRTSVQATGRYVVPFLDALAKGAPTGEAAAFSAWLAFQSRNVGGKA
ncbi:hypothetical protein FCJ61_04950 [Burkholderia metallica]|uniref:hypothetical protein n=1 Tax=Burkholderia metallica TaxID=488729 RepID=UPI00157A7D56|nr:hypothetical protein [Burkholderia metallica]NTZ82381.1 hypothetical protein [Burkholderia metallica]